MKKKLLSIVFAALILMIAFLPKSITPIINASEGQADFGSAKSVVLIERNSKSILSENNSHERLPIASVTKLMTILLTLENIEAGNISLDDNILVSKNASGMGGSQVFIDANGTYNLGELLKSVIVASANDSSVALAEHIAGSEQNFVRIMNERARELGLKDTNYVNCTGLPSVDGYSSSYDQALVLNEVLRFDTYHAYSSIWMEDFVHPSGRVTQMTNTNRLSRFYPGCIGGKTGSTNQAKYCLAVGASKNDMDLIAVVLGADNSKDRFAIASNLLDYGFENFESTTLFSNHDLAGKTVRVKGMNRSTELYAEKSFSLVTKRGEEINYSLNFNLPDVLTSCNAGDIIGNVEIVVDGVVKEKIDLLAKSTVIEATIWDYIQQITKAS